MINTFRQIICVAFAVAAFSVKAQTPSPLQPPQQFLPWVFSVHYGLVSEDGADLVDDMAIIMPSLGYRFPLMDKLEVIPTVTVGKGIEEDVTYVKGTDVKVTLDNIFALSAKFQYDFEKGIYGYLSPSMINVGYNVDNSRFGYDKPDIEDDLEFGIGIGVGYKLVRNISAELLYETYDDTDILSAGLHFFF